MFMEKEESIILVWYFENQYLNQIELILFFEKINNDLFNEKFEEISYSDNKQRDKNLKYNLKNVNRYLIEAKDSDMGFQLSNYLDNYKYKSVDLKFSVCLNSNSYKQTLSSIYIIINKKVYTEQHKFFDLNVLYKQISEFLIFKKIILKYGFMFSFDNEKFPLMFVSGIGNFLLTDFEENSIMNWRKNRDNADKRVWDVFGGNLITSRHIINNHSITDIVEIVGDRNIVKLSEDLYYFNLSEESLKFGKQDKKTRTKLLNILNK